MLGGKLRVEATVMSVKGAPHLSQGKVHELWLPKLTQYVHCKRNGGLSGGSPRRCYETADIFIAATGNKE